MSCVEAAREALEWYQDDEYGFKEADKKRKCVFLKDYGRFDKEVKQ